MAGQRRYPDAASLVRALRVIRTWAEFDVEEGIRAALLPKAVVALCDRALDEWIKSGGVSDE